MNSRSILTAENAPPVPKLELVSGVFVSLLDMIEYAANIFFALADSAGRVAGLPPMAIMGALNNDDYMRHIRLYLGIAKKECTRLEWQESVSRIEELEAYLASQTVVPIVAQSKFQDLQTHIHRVLKERLFFHIEKSVTTEYFEWVDGVSLWRDNFPAAYLELASAVKCYMFDQNQASVFHSMRAVELGLGLFAKEAGITVGSRDQWETIINNIEAAIKNINGPHAGTDWKKKQEAYSEAALHFRFIKNAWRNHIMHVRHTYDAKKAKEIWQHATGFIADSLRLGVFPPQSLDKLATTLP